MKTTFDLPEALFREAKEYAARRGIPLREVVERGLRMAVRGAGAPRKRFRLKTVTTKGEGLAVDGGWPAIRSMIYKGQGG